MFVMLVTRARNSHTRIHNCLQITLNYILTSNLYTCMYVCVFARILCVMYNVYDGNVSLVRERKNEIVAYYIRYMKCNMKRDICKGTNVLWT